MAGAVNNVIVTFTLPEDPEHLRDGVVEWTALHETNAPITSLHLSSDGETLTIMLQSNEIFVMQKPFVENGASVYPQY